MTYTNTPAVVSQQTTGYTSGNIPYTNLTLIAGIPHSAQLEVERIFTQERDGNTANLLAFLADPAITTAQKKEVFIVPISRCTLDSITTNITAIDLPASGATVYNYVVGGYTILVPAIGGTITVRRKTVSNEPFVNWQAGSRLTSKQLNLSTTQSLYLMQEVLEKIGTSVTIETTQITAASIAANSVNTSAIVNSAVTTAKILDANVTTAKIADSAITSAKIADGTILNADINASAGIVDTKLATISTVGKVSNSATTATSNNTANTIVARDGNSAAAFTTVYSTLIGNVTGNVTGNASGLSATLAVASGGTGVTTSTGSDANVLATSPALVTPTIDTHPLTFNTTLNTAAPIYAVSGFVSFDGTTILATLNGATLTAARTAGSTIATITTNSDHGLITGNIVSIVGGAIAAGDYSVTVSTTPTPPFSTLPFTITTAATTAITAGTAITVRCAAIINKSDNIKTIAMSSVAGTYYINLNDSITGCVWIGSSYNQNVNSTTQTSIKATTATFGTMLTAGGTGTLTSFAFNSAILI